MKMCMIFVPLFSQDNPMEWIGRPKSEIFIFQKVKPTWNQSDLSSFYVAACLLHLRNKLYTSLLGDRRDRLSLLNVAQTGIFERLSATFNETETRKRRGYVWKANTAHICFVWKCEKLKILFKCPLVNETLRPETETRPRRLAFSPRRDRDRDLPSLCRDRDKTETFEKYVSRPSRDRDVETETTTLVEVQSLVSPIETAGHPYNSAAAALAHSLWWKEDINDIWKSRWDDWLLYLDFSPVILTRL